MSPRPDLFMPWTSARQSGSPKFFSRINLDAAGHSQSFQPRLSTVGLLPLRGLPLFSGDTGSFILCAEEFEYFKAFFNARKGKLSTFLHRNWMDYTVTKDREVNCVDPNSYSQGVTIPDTGNGIITVFPLVKKYSNTFGGEHYRRIFRPVPGTLKVFVNNLPSSISEWRLTRNGRLVFYAPPTGVITFSCEYDLLVRFDSDSYAAEVLNAKPGEEEFKINSIPIVEVAINDSSEAIPVTPEVVISANPLTILEGNLTIVSVQANPSIILEGGEDITVSASQLILVEGDVLPRVTVAANLQTVPEDTVSVIITVAASSNILIEGT
jgi:uncharacterized protein (TIGR02217 family)